MPPVPGPDHDPRLVVRMNWDDDGTKTVIDEPRLWSGAVSTSVLRFVARRFGERKLKDVLDALTPSAKSVFEAGVADTDWVPYEAHNALVQTVDAVLGRDDLHLVVQCGRAAAEGAFELMRSVDPPAPTPISLLSRMPMVVGALLRGAVLDVERVGHGHGRLGLDEKGEPSLPANVFLIGFFDRSLDRFGAREIEVNMLSSRALGDAQTVYEVSWLA